MFVSPHWRSLIVVAGLTLSPPAFGQSVGQSDDLGRQVKTLVRKLDSNQRTDREEAEQALIQLGAPALNHLPAVDESNLSAEQKVRLTRISTALLKARLAAEVQARSVQWNRPLPLDELIKEIARQTGNPIADLRPTFKQPTDNPTIDPTPGVVQFWPVMDEIARKAKVSFYHHNDERVIGLSGRPEATGKIAYASAFRFMLQKLSLQRDFAAPDAPAICLISIDGLVEPRLRPLLVEFSGAKFAAVDDAGRSIPYAGPESYPVVLEKNSYQFPLSIRMHAPDRSARAIAKLSGELGVWMPAQVEEFVVDKLTGDKPTRLTKSGVRITAGPVTDDAGVWTVPVIVEQFGDRPPVESHLQQSLEPEIYLQTDEGTRFDQNGGLSTTVDEPGKVGLD